MADGRTTYQQRVRCVFGRTGSANPLGEGDPHCARQSVGAQDSGCGALPGTDHPHVRFHFTPTYSSWLNQVELWFAKIQRDVIARGVFTSLADLRRKLMKYIRHYNNVPKRVKWRYFDASHRITSTSAVTVH